MAKVIFDKERCKGCGLCETVCPKQIIQLEKEKINQKGYHPAGVIDMEKCIGCGICAKNCPVDAITRTDYIAPGHKLASFAIDAEKCVKCGVCVGNCKFKAVVK
jgi:formate hydrogenlyase subunit 6/NADH:ubiquinone oxidoreductase subunit I